MSVPTPNCYIVVAFDAPDGARDTYRQEHLAGATSAKEAGTLGVGGAILNEDATKMVGSTMLFKAASLEDVRKIVEADPYYKNGVWDKERITILPFFQAF